MGLNAKQSECLYTPVWPLREDEIRDAARVVARCARDDEDRDRLLDALGLQPVQDPSAPDWLPVLALAGASRAQIAKSMGKTRSYVAQRLTQAYRALGVAHVPTSERRAAAVLEARRRGLL